MQWILTVRIRNIYGKKSPDNAILRHKENDKWYAAFLIIPAKKLGLADDGSVDVVNVKCSPLEIGSLLQKKGFFPAYHMNKTHWVSILLDGSVTEEELLFFLNASFEITE